METNVQFQSRSLADADAVLVALKSRRFVVVRRDSPPRMMAANPICKRIRDLQPGDEVFYDGKRETVQTLCEY